MVNFSNVVLPFSYPLNGQGIPIGAELNLDGFVETSQESFEINLLNTHSGDIALHVKVRGHGHRRTLVVNSCRGGRWEQEKSEGLRLDSNERLYLTIQCLDAHYKIKIKDYEIRMEHRHSRAEPNQLNISGGVRVMNLYLMGFDERPPAYAPNYGNAAWGASAPSAPNLTPPVPGLVYPPPLPYAPSAAPPFMPGAPTAPPAPYPVPMAPMAPPLPYPPPMAPPQSYTVGGGAFAPCTDPFCPSAAYGTRGLFNEMQRMQNDVLHSLHHSPHHHHHHH